MLFCGEIKQKTTQNNQKKQKQKKKTKQTTGTPLFYSKLREFE